MKSLYQPSKEEICALFESPIFTHLKNLSPAEVNAVAWWLEQPSKTEAPATVPAPAPVASSDLDGPSSKMLAFVTSHPGCARRDILKGTSVKDAQYGAARKTLMERNLIRQEGTKITSRFYPV